MSISALPEAATQALVSSQVIIDSVSVVRELVGNALDASASSISVEISANAVDVIQVSDNGHGIAADDRALVGKRHCTSKIRSMADLSALGGKSLGFRGEALASIVEISEKVMLSTRVTQESVGVKYSLKGTSQSLSEQRISHPVGTTIRVMKFLTGVPAVQRQGLAKNPAKTLERVKLLLQAHALARPSVRMSLRVLQAESDKMNWVHAAKPSSTLADAALHVVGASVSAQCELRTWSSHDQRTRGRAASEEDCFALTAFLPRAGCEIKAVQFVGQYISIDSRPLDTSKGTLRKVVSIYKSAFMKANVNESPSKPVLCLNIVCPTASYDVNVEPAKDDVLFADEDALLKIYEQFFGEYYSQVTLGPEVVPECRVRGGCDTMLMDDASTPASRHHSIDHIGELDSKQHASDTRAAPPHHDSLEPLARGGHPHPPVATGITRPAGSGLRAPRSHTQYDDDGSDKENQGVDGETEGLRALDPWTIARLNARSKPRAAPLAPLVAAPPSVDHQQALTPISPARISLPHTFSSSPSAAQQRPKLRAPSCPLTPAATSPLSKYSSAPQQRRTKASRRPMDDWLSGAPTIAPGHPGPVSSRGTALEEIPDASPRSRVFHRQEPRSSPLKKPFSIPLKRAPVTLDDPGPASPATSLHHLDPVPACSVSESPEVQEGGLSESSEDLDSVLPALESASVPSSLVCTCSAVLDDVSKSRESIKTHDAYTRGEEQTGAFARPDFNAWEKKLRSMPMLSGLDNALDLRCALRGHLAMLGK